MERFRASLGDLRLRWFMARWAFTARVAARAIALIGLTALAAYLVAIFLAPEWTLKFSRVLAWPVVALLAVAAFKLPLERLLHGQALSRVAVGPVTAELQQREATDPAAGVGSAPLDPDTERVIFVLGVLAQIYQKQIDFLRHLRLAGDGGLTAFAGIDWWRAALDDAAADASVVEPLIQWLSDRNLLYLRDDDHYVLLEGGRAFLESLEGFWYAPKAI